MLRSIALVAVLLVGACSSPGHLDYVAPSSPVMVGPGAIADVQVTDKRDEKPNRLATIRGGYGNPLKVLDTIQPVSEEVKAVFVKALTLRGMLRAGGPAHLEVVLHTLYGDQFIGRKVELLFDLIVRDGGGRVLYSDRIVAKDYEYTFLDNGVFASIDTLGKAVQTMLNKAVDEVLDKAALRDALQRVALSASTAGT